ncbi:hypothetical protein CBR_g56398 [Chara braunii]|uniref:Myb-like domain-containing protein n=1 Tax=Chara braunii TaxID=69332 RepID=A0A388MDH2_CHABU|nr:hypothetical protein CBR_g56398 [Chara braunii]|eukprot:GBG92610.1 hypothetical protein CBR_g56398 [Chara braunii]
MADVRRRLTLLVLAVVVFLIVIFLHVCFSWRPWKQQRKRRASTRRAAAERLTAGMQARPAATAGQGGVRSSAAEPRRRYNPSMYTHLEPWDTPLPPSNEEPEKEELSTLPLSSGSTQLWSQTVRAGGSALDEGGEFTSLLHQGLRDDDDRGIDLRFGLCSGGGREASRTFIIDGDRSALGIEHGGSLHMEQSTLRRAAPVTSAVGPSPAGRQHGSTAPSVDRLTRTWPAPPGVAAGPLRMGGARSLMPACTTPIESGLRDEGTCRAPVRPRPTVENITRGGSNMRAHSDGGEDDVGFGDDADEGMREDVEAGDDDDDVPIRPLGKAAGRGRGRGRGGVCGRSVARGGRGGVSDDAGKSPTYWSAEDQMLLVRCKREQDMHLAGLSHNYGRMKTKEWKWEDMSKRMANAGRPKDADDCMKKWDNLLTNEERKEHNFTFRMDRALYNEIHAGMVGNHTIFPPNVADTGSPDGVQLPRRGAGGGESVCSEAAGEGCPDERSSARESDSNVGSGAGGGKRKKARQQAFESIFDVMERHGALMSSTIESSSKRQCSTFTRQCDILEQEIVVQKTHYAASDEMQRMMCHTLLEIAAAIRGRSSIVAHPEPHKCRPHEGDSTTLLAVPAAHFPLRICSATTLLAGRAGRFPPRICSATMLLVRRAARFPPRICSGTTLLVGRAARFPPRIYSATTLLVGPAAHFPPRICSATTLLNVIASALLAVNLLAAEHSRHREGQVRALHRDRLWGSPASMSARLNARGKKRDVAFDETQAQGKGRRHVPKAKRPRLDDASASVPHRGARGWSQPAEEDNDDDFMTEDDQGEATASAGRELATSRLTKPKPRGKVGGTSQRRRGYIWIMRQQACRIVECEVGRKPQKRTTTMISRRRTIKARRRRLQAGECQAAYSGSERFEEDVNPSAGGRRPEAQQLRVRQTWKEKGVVVDLGGEDDEPLEKRRLHSATQATTAAVSTARVAEDERPITGSLPCTPSHPRQRNDGVDGASRQRGGGGGVVADARAVGGEAAGGAGVAVAGVVPPVQTAREEAAVPATVREEGHGQNTNQRDGGEAASSRARRGVMTKVLIDRALLWVDDKAFWTTGEGRRLYNVVHETKEYFLAIACGLQPPELPRSVVVPKSNTRVARIADQSQLQQAISHAAAVENIALRILHGWVFKYGNRPRGYHLAFQYSLESVATDIRVQCGTARSGATSSARRCAPTR